MVLPGNLNNYPNQTPSLLNDNATLERLEGYRIKYCPRLKPEKMQKYIQRGEELERNFASAKDISELKDVTNRKAVRDLVWLLTAKAARDDELFLSGAMRIEDPDHKLELFIKACGGKRVYRRISSHMNENILSDEMKQNGFDFKARHLPWKRRTVLFARQPDGTLFLKIETRGLPPFWQKEFRSIANFFTFACHSINYLRTRFRRENKGYRHEFVPKKTKKDFAKLIKEIEEDLILRKKYTKEGNTFGLSKMDEILSGKEGDHIESFKKEHFQPLIHAKKKNYNSKVKGKEVVLPPLGS